MKSKSVKALTWKYQFIPARDFSFICSNIFYRGPCPQIFLKDVRRFSTKQIKCRYLHEINKKSRAGINGYFYIKNPLLWKWHFHKILCEEMISTAFQSIIFSFVQWKYHFFTQKFVEMPHLPKTPFLILLRTVFVSSRSI